MAAAALVASQLFRGALGGLPLSLLLLPCATVVVVYAGTRRLDVAAPITRLGDPSYGMYIYGFVLQQVLITIGARDLSTAAFAGVSIAAALLLGYASWHLVERRFVEVAPRHVPAADPA
jgi:peptidoglycan/LPS O-acetylase OafA/YrhL